jgi:hypothetical protein
LIESSYDSELRYPKASNVKFGSTDGGVFEICEMIKMASAADWDAVSSFDLGISDCSARFNYRVSLKG